MGKIRPQATNWQFRAIAHQESSEDLPDSDGQLEQEDVPDRLGSKNGNVDHENDAPAAHKANDPGKHSQPNC